MADDRKYYYLKLKDNFFESDNMILMENMKDGYLYENILLKLYLKSLKDGGRLMLNGRIPYNSQMIASITRHQVGTVEKALKVFEELELVEVLDNGVIYMLDIQNFIGESSTEADRKREYRARIEREKTSGQIEGQMSAQMTGQNSPEIRDKRLDIRYKKREVEKKRFAPPSIEEIRTYCQEKNYDVDPEQFIDFYESKDWMIGKNKMQNWKAAVNTWARRDKNKGQQAAKKNSFNNMIKHGFDYNDLEKKLLNLSREEMRP